MATYKTTNLNTSEEVNIITSINSADGNKILLDNIGNYYNFEDELVVNFSILTKYDNILRTGLVDYVVSSDYQYRPEYVSYDLYGTTDLWYILLYVNDMIGPLEFTTGTIKVPTALIIPLINKIINYEGNILYTRTSPKSLSKHVLKSLLLPSDKILATSYDSKIPMYKETKLIDNINILDEVYASKRNIDVNIESIKDENGDYINGFKCFSSDSNLVSVPTNNYIDGLSKTFTTGIKLDKDKTYTFMNVMNGNTSINIYNENNSIKLNEEFKEGVPKIIYDFRNANFDNLYYFDPVSTLKFNENNGKYYLDFNKVLNSLGKNRIFTIKIDQNEIDRLDLTRLVRKDYDITNTNSDPGLSEEIINYNDDDSILVKTEYDYLFVNVEYSSSYKYDENTNNGISVKLTFQDGTNLIYGSTFSESDFVYPKKFITNGEIVNLSIPIKIPPTKKGTIADIEIYSEYNTIKTGGSGSFKLYSVHITGYLNSSFAYDFQVKEDDYYNIILNYNYTSELNKNNKCLLFNCKLLEDTEELKPLYYDMDAETEFGSKTDLIFLNEFNTGKNNAITILSTEYPLTSALEKSNDYFTLDEKYVINFRINMNPLNNTGSLGFLFDSRIDSKNNLYGYMIILSNTPAVDGEFDISNDSDYSIMETGIYKLDPLKLNEDTKSYKYLTDIDKYTIDAVLIQSLKNSDILNKNLKIIKKLNTFAIVNKDYNEEWKDGKFIVPYITDYTNYYTYSGIGYINLFHKCDNLSNIKIDNYFTYL